MALKLNPPIPWTGSKRRFASRIVPHFPKSYKTYYEPFIGGGSVFLTLQPKKAVIADSMCHIISVWKAIKSNPKELIAYLKKYKTYGESNFNKTKKLLNDKKYKNNVQHAAAFIYLIKSSFRRIYRENKKGEIACTFDKEIAGKKWNYDYENIMNIHEYMKKASIRIMCCSYEKALAGVTRNDLVYLDPPYLFTDFKSVRINYGNPSNKNLFDNQQLFDIMNKLNKKGAHIIMSNSYHAIFKKKLDKDFRLKSIASITAYGNLNTKESKGNKNQKEIILYNTKNTPRRK